jgi:ABC-type dipeptide/oligopeptide/nickel transport systems, permease components
MRYLARRLATLVLTLLLVSLLTFGAFNLVPGDPVSLILGTEASPERVAVLRDRLGLDLSPGARYATWLAGFARGDCGVSIKYSLPVAGLVAARLPATLALALLALAITAAISIPLGIYCAKRRGTVADRTVLGASTAVLSIPNFFLGVLFIWLFGLVFKLFAPGGYVDYRVDLGRFLGYMAFPALAIALPNAAVVVKFLRGAAIGELRADYVRTARSKGAAERRVLYRHVLKNAMIPVVALFGMIVAETFSGSVIVEQVFSVPGIGRLLVSSITSRDFPLVETLVIYIAFIVVAANFAADIVIQLLDPRIELK